MERQRPHLVVGGLGAGNDLVRCRNGVTYPVRVGGGTPFFAAVDSWVNLVETRTFPGGVVLTRYETRR